MAFIRPTASSLAMGGVANKTREAMLLCEAAGFEVIIVETVGVGQSEISVKNMVDFFLLLVLAGAGDELQGHEKRNIGNRRCRNCYQIRWRQYQACQRSTSHVSAILSRTSGATFRVEASGTYYFSPDR